MNVDIKMPDLATADSEVTIIRWLVEAGQPVKLGQPLVEIETDKATMEVESVAAGILEMTLAAPGERVAVGQVIASIATGEKVTAPAPAPVQQAAPIPQPAIQPAVATSLPPTPRQSLFARNKAARALKIRPTDSRIPLNSNQREIARRMAHSKQTIPHFYLTTSANAEPMAAIRAQTTPKIAWDAFFVLATARALQAFDRMLYRVDDDALVRRETDAIGVAVDLDDALYVIAIENPLTGTFNQISQQIESKVEAIRRGDVGAKRPVETCITISNLGAENIETFTAIVNPPESAILAIGKVAPVVVAQDTWIGVQKRVSLTLSVDHRIVNGKYAARFFNRIVTELESL
ncbi:MAG: 2-oxo acid dehydrogenase subunit E2 [Anaerolineae bacterium]|nr:2-oxo acid dehydrogenase subunit E2 [Anaerolineae bacterium]